MRGRGGGGGGGAHTRELKRTVNFIPDPSPGGSPTQMLSTQILPHTSHSTRGQERVVQERVVQDILFEPCRSIQSHELDYRMHELEASLNHKSPDKYIHSATHHTLDSLQVWQCVWHNSSRLS